MFNLKFQNLLSVARDRVKTATDLKSVVSVALGIALSRTIQLPSNEVDDAYGHYANTLSYAACVEAAKFNENLPVDMDLVEGTCRSFWLMRYFHAYPLRIVPLLGDDETHFLGRINGVGHLISPPTFQLCQDNASLVIHLQNLIRELLDI